MSLKTRSFSIHLTNDGSLLEVVKDMPARTALDLAAELGESVHLLSERLYDAINEDGESVYACEMRGISLLSEIAAALTRSVAGNMEAEGEA